MSYMIPPGTYKIANVLYPNRYVCMSGNKDFVGHDVGDTIKVEVKDEVQHLATLYDTVTSLYIGIDMLEGKAKGYTEPKELQLSSTDGKYFELVRSSCPVVSKIHAYFRIHMKSSDDVCVLKNDKDWSEIVVEAAPASDEKYWKFEKA
ncbi:hypothetical protein CY34DRAFT_676600 [Suillus luteus UH-Slu-Lm8-n1]|uniref:Uncharacterized protein n=1 Tax=Suillus luteus UH-Slu-Lm8-n1 TaxID=930992 RepID=A0A0D0BKU1_9AGAM|nr:hypothetical protein CY34DRAFT_676600 [Suillus luteus UH-Slu-Lm8-n1]